MIGDRIKRYGFLCLELQSQAVTVCSGACGFMANRGKGKIMRERD